MSEETAGTPDQKKSKRPLIKGILIFAVTQIVIGNLVAFYFGAWPIPFDPKPLTARAADVAFFEEALTDDPDDVSALVGLGRLYFDYNHLPEADEVLSRAVTQAPGDGEALVLYHSNKMKIAGDMFDPFMGLFKLRRTYAAIEGLEDAVAAAPEDPIVRIGRLATLSRVGDVKGAHEQVLADLNWFDTNAERLSLDGQLEAELAASTCQALNNFEDKLQTGLDDAVLQRLRAQVLEKGEPVGGDEVRVGDCAFSQSS